ncbi:MAG: hypothetical protein MJH10_10490 [Epibacterium sp.]|nr:hypothetical protein [Epibacterium sp.]NQX73968.1 hypothetical protein [Epibacterium sp.]
MIPSVREVADNAWLLLISRMAAGISIPFVCGAFVFAWTVNANQEVMKASLRRHEDQIQRNAERIATREANAFTAADAAAMEARSQRDFELLMGELRALRAEMAEERRRNGGGQ